MSQISRIVAAGGAQTADARIIRIATGCRPRCILLQDSPLTQRARSSRNIRGLLSGQFNQLSQDRREKWT